MSIGFNRDPGRRQQELTNNKNIKGKFYVRFMMKDVLAFAELQEEAKYGLCYNSNLTRKKDEVVIHKARDIDDARLKLIISTSLFLLKHLPFKKKEKCLSRF